MNMIINTGAFAMLGVIWPLVLPVTAAAMANHSPLFGLIERITVFTFILWMFVIARQMTHSKGTLINKSILRSQDQL